jgi:hypothetical protein
MTSPQTYDDIKALAVALGRPVSTLIALADRNDPFYCHQAVAAIRPAAQQGEAVP